MKSTEREALSGGARSFVGLGELIWDLLPEGKQLGGAPANFVYIASLLGNRATVASRIGSDELGLEARERLKRMGIETSHLQVDRLHPTGTVKVRIGERGEAHFEMNENSAWDYLEWTPEWEDLALETDAVCFGTPGQRRAQARETILRFLRATRPNVTRIFDVNLRHTFFTPEMLRDSLALSTIVKLSSEELTMVARMLELEASGREAGLAEELLTLFELELVAVTRGEKGSLLLTREGALSHEGIPVRVQDTIGAGDAFTATLTHYYLQSAPLEITSEAANRMGAWIATQAGATPEVNVETLREILGSTFEYL